MARRYSFGTANSGSRNLSSLIQSLSNSMQDSQDSEEFNAFNNGGVGPDGKPVTPASLLGYIKGRMGQYDPSNPDYIKWENKLTQTEFSIGEANIGAAYKAGKATAGQVAAFYKSWLPKAPKDSGFYDTILNQISAFSKAAKGSASGSVTKVLTARTSSMVSTINAGQAFDAAVLTAAYRGGVTYNGTGKTLTASDFDPVELEKFINGLGSVMVNGRAVPVTMSLWAAKDASVRTAWAQIQHSYQVAGRSTKGQIDDGLKAATANLLANRSIDFRDKVTVIVRDAQTQAAQTNDPSQKAKIYADAVTALSAVGTPQALAGVDDFTAAGFHATVDLYNGKGIPGQNDVNGANISASDASSITQTYTLSAAMQGGIVTMGQTSPGAAFQPIAVPPALSADQAYVSYMGADGHVHTGILDGTAVKQAGTTSIIGYQYNFANGFGQPAELWSTVDKTGKNLGFVAVDPFKGSAANASGIDQTIASKGSPIATDPSLQPQDLTNANNQPDPARPGYNLLGYPLGGPDQAAYAQHLAKAAQSGPVATSFGQQQLNAGSLGPNDRPSITGLNYESSMEIAPPPAPTPGANPQTVQNENAMGNPSAGAPPTPTEASVGRYYGIPGHNYGPGWSDTAAAAISQYGGTNDRGGGELSPQPNIAAPSPTNPSVREGGLIPHIALPSVSALPPIPKLSLSPNATISPTEPGATPTLNIGGQQVYTPNGPAGPKEF